METYTKCRIRIQDSTKLKGLTNALQTDIILFSGALDSNTWRLFEEFIPSNKKLTILIRGCGGFYYNDELDEYLMGFLKNKYQTIDIIILDYAKSTLSVLALSCDNLYLLKESSGIGTIDPIDPKTEKSCFYIIKPEQLSFYDVKCTVKCTINNNEIVDSLKRNIEFTIDNSYASMKQGNILLKEKDLFHNQFIIMLGIEKDSGIDFKTNHSTEVKCSKLEQIGLQISNLSPDITKEIAEVYDELISQLGVGNKDKIEYYVFEYLCLSN